MDLSEVPKVGYGEFNTVLSSYSVIQFAVPCHEWTKLAKSKEWMDFVCVLEKFQREHIQKQHLTVECLQEVLDCK